ncbi:hypothetical protein RI367_007290 [Sorochytrium milnesiophthora]
MTTSSQEQQTFATAAAGTETDAARILESAFCALGAEDFAKARELLDKARKHGNKMAACYLGKLEERDGNLHAAEEYYRLSARTQCPEGLRCLGAFLLKHRKQLDGRTEEECLKEATQTLESAVRHGEGLSAYYLGNQCLRKQSADGRAEAIQWYRQGVQLDNTDCMRCLSNLYQSASDLEPLAYAVELYKQAADLGDAAAKLQLALMSLNGYRANDDEPWLVERDLQAAQRQLEKLSEIPEHAINPLLRVMVLISMARIPYLELKANQADQARQKKVNLSRERLLRAHTTLSTIEDDVRTSLDLSATQLRQQPRRWLEDYSEALLSTDITIDHRYTRQSVTDLIYFRFAILVLVDMAYDLDPMLTVPKVTPSEEEIAGVWDKLRTAADVAYVGASRYNGVQCMLVLSMLCQINIPSSADRLPQYSSIVQNCPEQYERSADYWWREKPYSSLRCQKNRVDGKGRCNAIDYNRMMALTEVISWAAEDIDPIPDEGHIFQICWVPHSAFGCKVTSAMRPLCADCEQVRDNRVLYPQRYYASDAPRDSTSQEALLNEADLRAVDLEEGSATDVQASCHQAIQSILQALLEPLAPAGDLSALFVAPT